MNSIHRLPRTKRVMRTLTIFRRTATLQPRTGFTLIELVIAMSLGIMLMVATMTSLNVISSMGSRVQSVADVKENLTTTLDQVVKELRETSSLEDGVGTEDALGGTFGVVSPVFSSSEYATTDLLTILDSHSSEPPLASGSMYTIDPNAAPILQFYSYDTSGTKHRIKYTLGIPVDGALPQRKWANQRYEPMCILYSNQTWNGSAWVGIEDQPMTGQVVTNFTVTRPYWNPHVVQIMIEGLVKGTGNEIGYNPVRLVAQVTLRQ